MPFEFDDEQKPATASGFVFDDERKPEPQGRVSAVLNAIKGFGTRFAAEESAGMDDRAKRLRQEGYDRSNAATQGAIQSQTNQLSDSERALLEQGKQAQQTYRDSQDSIGIKAVDLIRDQGLGFVKGAANTAVKLPLALVGIAEDATGTRSALESVGYRSKDALGVVDQFGNWLESLKSDAGQGREKQFDATRGATATLLELGANPKMVMDKVSESLFGIGAIGKTAGAAVAQAMPKLIAMAEAKGLTGAAAEEFITNAATKIAQIAAPVSEGAQSGLDIAGTAQQHGRTLDQYGLPTLAAAAGTALIGYGSNKLGAKAGIGDIETDIALRGTRSTAAKSGPGGFAERVIKEGAKEGLIEEGPQSVGESAAENVAMGRPWDQGLGKSVATGAVTGGAMGGAHASIGGQGEPAQPAAAASPDPAPVAQQPKPAVIAAQEMANPAAKAPETSAAEKALLAPVELTSLDRVNEIDKADAALRLRADELNKPGSGYGPMFDQERNDLTEQQQELASERAELTKGWPKAVPGTESSFTTEAGARVNAQYSLMDAGDLITSHDEGLRKNPLYPPELQPRERDRAASEMQVSGIVQKLDPARLGLSADAANGAPIVGADGLVESGNARTIALKRVYQANGQKASDYKQWLRDNAQQFGITSESVDAMAKPVLVRVRTTPVNRAEFARQANASTVAMMSPSEQAKSDANRIDTMEDLTPDDNGDFSNAASRPFVRRFMARLPMTEQAGMIDSSGNLSTSGYARVRNAVLAKAYGDSPVLARMTESMDDNLRNVSRALMLAAPKVAQMRQAVKAGDRFDADITPDLMAAVEELSKIKDDGGSVQDALAQTDIMGDQRTPEARQLLQFLNDNMRRPRRMADFIVAYMDALDAMGDPRQDSMFGDTQAPAKADLLTAAEKATQNVSIHAPEGANTGAMLNEVQDSGPKGESASPKAGAQDGRQPKDAQGSGGGAQTNGVGNGSRQNSDTKGQPNAEIAKLGDTRLSRGAASEWVNFPKELGTIGIPRADMPQIKGSDRGALIQFLRARGIDHKTTEVKPTSLKPTQAEFSTKKAANWAEIREGVDRSVLVSNDGYILDGHHQWVSALASNEPVKAIVLDSPIRELMANVFQFPSVKQSADSAKSASEGSKARDDFKAAMADLADYMMDKIGARAMIAPPGSAELRKILVRLFVAAIDEVGTDIKTATKWVKGKLKTNLETKKWWNKVSDKDYQDAALEAVEQGAKQHVDDLFAAAEKRQADLFGDAPEQKQPQAPKLILGKDAPPKSKPVVMVFGGSFNPVHEGHVGIALDAKRMLEAAGYSVDASIVVPSPQHLLVKKSGDKANLLGHRTAMAKLAFKRLEKHGFTVNDESSRIADANEGARKPKRYDTADWAQEQHPGATVINVTGQDQAHEEAPGFPSVYKVLSESGKNRDGYYFLALPRDESEATGISSSKIRKKIDSDEDVPSEWANSAVVRYAKALVKKSREIAIDGHLLDLDAMDFGRPFPKTLPDDSPVLVETYSKQRHDEVAKSIVRFKDFDMPRSAMWQHIEDEFFDGKIPAPTSRKPIAYVMGGGGASGKGTIKAKLVKQGLIHSTNAIDIDADEIKGQLPEYGEAWKHGDSRGAAVVHEESSMLSKLIRARAINGQYDVTLDVTLGNPEKGLKELQELKNRGYEVRLFGVNIEPETAVRRAIDRGFSNGRFVPIKSLLEAHAGFAKGWESYWPIVDQARLYDTSDGILSVAEKVGDKLDIKHKKAYHRFGERGAINDQSRTYAQIGTYRGRASDAGGQANTVQGRSATDPGIGSRVGNGEGSRNGGSDQESDQSPKAESSVNANDSTGQGRAQGQSTRPLQATPSKRKAERVRDGSGGQDLFGDSVDDNGGPPNSPLGQTGPNDQGQQNEGGRKSQSGNGTRADAGVPAGRDIPAKSGLNYQFGADDLTYEGSWFKKAEQNIEAVELLRKLETEARQATPDEQKILAKFVGWGASELANNLFGTKLDKAANTLEAYKSALDGLERVKQAGRDYLQKGGQYRGQYADTGYYQAVEVLKASGSIKQHDYPQRVTREELEKAKPDSSSARWLALRDRLAPLMDAKQKAQGAKSTQYAHYTSKSVVSSMWKAMARMGFKGGHILEPGAGIGVFAGLMPQATAMNSTYTGIEFDATTGGILKQLFPDERILVESFMDSKLPKNFYDVAIGNPPFQTKSAGILSDPEYAKHAFALHDYFFAKSIDRVKPGGLVVYITSRYTMDKLGDKARKYLADRADLVGAIRLPQTAFKQNAGTEVVTDVIFLRKKVKGETFEHAQPWMGLAQAKAADGSDLTVSAKEGDPDQPALINEYFAAHPEMVLGHNSNAGSMYKAKEYTVTPFAGDIEEHFAKAVENLPADIYQAQRGSSAEAAKVREIDFNPKAKKEGNYYVTDAGVLMQRESGVGQRAELKNPKDVELVKDFVPLRDALKQAHYDQLNNGDWEASLKALQKAYDAFTKKNGAINQFTSKTVKVKAEELDEDGNPTGNMIDDEEVRRSFPLLDKLKDDPDWTLVQALETLNEDTGVISRGTFLERRVLGMAATVQAGTPTDALLTTLNDLGRVDMAVIAQRIGLTEQETIEALGSSVYDDPEQGWTTADDYLSGNVKRKLDLARSAAKSDRRYQRNVTALEAHQPEPLTPSQINPRLGMNWIPGDVYAQFMREKVGLDMSMEWEPRTRSWHFGWDAPETHQITTKWGKVEKTYRSLAGAEKSLAKMNEGYDEPRFLLKAIENKPNKAALEDWGTPNYPAQELMENAITGAPVKVYSKDEHGKPYMDAALTEAAGEKLKKLHAEFESWVFSEPNRSDRLVQMYNDKFNTTVARSFDGSHLTLPGASMHWQKQVHAHVKRGVWRIVQTGNTYLAHAVGSGKTAQMVMSAMEQKRLGLIKKPMIVVPNHMLKQFASEWLDIYPAARLMVADEHNFHTDNRRRFVSRVALSDLDGVVITHSAFKLLDLDPDFKIKMIEEQLAFFRAALEEAGGDPDKLTVTEETDAKTGKVKVKVKGSGSQDPKIKRIEAQIENMEQKLHAAMSSEGKDKNVRFDELGVDFLYVDEAHEFRKLDFTTVRDVKGLSPQGSGRAFDLFMKSRYLESKTPGRSMVMASGTPVTNTVAELYSVQKMLGYQALVDKGMEDFDSWASMFGREKTSLEPDASGKYENVTRFNDFVNIPEMTQMFREFADVLTADYLAEKLGDKRPKVEGGGRTSIITPETAEYDEFRSVLESRMKASKAWKPSKDEPNNPDPIIRIIGDGRLAAIDMRFMDPRLPSNPDSKLNSMIDGVIAAWKETADQEYTGKDGKVEPTRGSTMMVFSDLGFGAGVAASRGFSARAWMEKRLRDAGIPMNQVAFMSDYKKSSAKLKLFSDVNAGRIRLLVGSSKSMGTGVNAQQRLKDLFHLDSPWFPADLEQREGRIVRQGNKNKTVRIKAYAAKGTYDEQMWGQLANKQLFIDKAMSGDPNVRSIEDAGAADMMAIMAGMVAKDPRVLKLAGLETDINKLHRLYQAHEDTRASYRQRFQSARSTVEWNEKRLPAADKAASTVQDLSGDKFTAKVGGATFTERTKWAEALISEYKDLTARGETQVQNVGEISGFAIAYGGETIGGQFYTKLMLDTPTPMELVTSPGTSPMGVAMRAQNAVAEVARLPALMRERTNEARSTMDSLSTRMEASFPMSELLAQKISERNALRAEMAAPSVEQGPDLLASPSNWFDDFDDLSLEDYALSGVVGMVGRNPVTRLSRGTGGGMDVKVLEALATRIQKRMPNMPKVHVLASPREAATPKALRDYIEKQGAMNDVDGALHRGELYLFASGLTDALRAEHVLAEHEAAHFGLRAILGDSLNTAMLAIYNNNAAMRQAATELQKRGKLSNAEATEEVIVDIPSSQLVTLKGWRKVVLQARDWLTDHGFDAMAAKLSSWLDGSLSDQQRADLMVANLVRGARAYMTGKRGARASIRPDTMLSGTLADDLAKQEQWLRVEAQSRGYKDIDQLAEKNYPLFEKLAELWRKKNPAENGVLLSRGEDAYSKAVRLWQASLGSKLKLGDSVAMPMPTVYRKMGLKPNILSLPIGYLKGITEKHTDIPANVLRDLPQLLSDPIVVIPYHGGGYRVMIDAQTAKSEPIVVGLSNEGRIQTITPMHNDSQRTGAFEFASQVEGALSKAGAKVYARNKEALVKTRATRGVAMGTFNPNHDSSTGAVPATIALRRDPRDKAILIYRDLVVKTEGEFGPGIRLSRAPVQATAAERADRIIQTNAATSKPIDALAKGLTRITGVERLTRAIYSRAGFLLDKYTPETIKAGMVSDYGVPEAVIDQRAMMQGRQRVQLRQAGSLIEKLATLTRAESRVAYEWMNETDPHTIYTMMHNLPEESVKVLMEVHQMIDRLSKEAVRMGQLTQEAYDRNKFAYLRRSYAKYTLNQTAGEKAGRARAISILGDQYKGRGLTESASMAQIQNAAPDWWKRKLAAGKADTSLKGEKFLRLERHAPSGQRTTPLPGMEGKQIGKLKEVMYWPVSEPIPSKFSEWSQAGTFEVRDVKGPNAIMWRDFTKDERENMGEIDEARFAIAKTLHAMIHDVEVGRYLEWLAHTQAKKEGETIPGVVVEASDRYADTFKPGEWVKVPDSKIQGTSVHKYGKLAGRYLPGPVWNDLRQTVNGQFKPFGDTYAKILSMWKASKTALSPAVHTNNIMSNLVMADWHDVTAGHTAKALRIIMGAHALDGAGGLGSLGNKAASVIGIADREAAREVMNRYLDSGGNIGSWATNEISTKQVEPLLAAMEKELAASGGNSAQAQIGVMSALQFMRHGQMAAAWDAAKGSKPGKIIGTEGETLMELYQNEDEVFRLASWLKAKEEGKTDMEAGKIARRSFMDYNINAPWVSALRNSALPFVSYSYRAVPMMLEIAGNKPHKLMKLMLLAGAVNVLGVMLAGGDDDKERKLLPEEKAGRIWGMVPKLIRMPWNDDNGSPVYLDIRRFIPVGDVLDVGANHAAIPLLPSITPGGPLAMIAEIVLNKTGFTGKPITLETDTPTERTKKVLDYIYKAFAPNILGLPGTYATTNVAETLSGENGKGKTDKFGRELSTTQAVASAFGVKLGSYPRDVLQQNERGRAQAMLMEIDKNITQLKRERQTNRISDADFFAKVKIQQEKKQKVLKELSAKMN